MPAKSAKQEKFMQAVAENPKFAKKVGVAQSVGREFTKSGGGMAESKAMMKKEVAFMKKKGAPKSMVKHEMKEAGMKKMALGGAALGALSRAVQQRGASVAKSPMTSKPPTQMQNAAKAYSQQRSGVMGAGSQTAPFYAQRSMPTNTKPSGIFKKGGGVKKMAGGGLAAGHKQADGVAKKGKTRAMQVKMAGGGKTKKYC